MSSTNSDEQHVEDTSPEPKRGVEQVLIQIIENLTSPDFIKQMVWAVGSIILAMLVAAVIMVIVGYNPVLAYIALIRGALLQPDRILFNATPLIFTGLSVALAFKCGLFNIGPEGQLYMGAMAATIVGYMIALPIIVHPIASLIVAAIVGGIWGLIPGLLKAYRGAHEVVTTMMMSYSAILFTQWLVTYPLKEPGEFQWIAQTPPLLETAWLPHLGSPFLHAGFLIAIGTVVVIDLLINRTVLGFEMRAVGANQEAARTAGINPEKNIALSLGIAGALAGIGGASEIMGYHHRFRDAWSTGLGWDGITVAVLGNNNPWGVLAAAIFFGALRTGGNSMQQYAQVPAEMVSVIQGLIVMFVAAPRIIDWLSERGNTYAIWFKEDSLAAVIHFLTTSWAILAAILGLTFAASAAVLTPIGSALLLLGALTALYGFARLLVRETTGPRIAFIAGLIWLGAVVAFVLTANASLVLTSSIVGGLGIILSGIIVFVLKERVFTSDLGGAS